MRELLAVEDVCGNKVRILSCEIAEHILVSRLACTEDNKLYILLAHSLHHIGDKVKALLISQTADNSHHELSVVLCKVELSLHSTLVVDLLFKHIVDVVLHSYHIVGIGVVIVIVDTVYDTSEVILSCPHKTVQTLTVEFCFDLLCIGGAYCCDSVSVNQSAL